MSKNYTIRPANLDDLDFLADAIISAEKSNSDKLSLATFFNLDEHVVKSLIIAMLDEEIEGCEFSVSSFLVVSDQGKSVAAVAGWIEGVDGELDSSILKSNLISYTFPPESIAHVKNNSSFINDLLIEREPKSLQIEYVYVIPNNRGDKLAQKLIEAHILRASQKIDLKKAQVQLFSNNVAAKKVYENIGFAEVGKFVSKRGDIFDYLAHNEKILMEKTI